jgi:rhodanese-related sulfurtransferase
MPTNVNRNEVRRLAAEGAQVVEVMPGADYEEEHLPGALSLPLKTLDEPAAAHVLRRGTPIVVYCYDTQ